MKEGQLFGAKRMAKGREKVVPRCLVELQDCDGVFIWTGSFWYLL